MARRGSALLRTVGLWGSTQGIHSYNRPYHDPRANCHTRTYSDTLLCSQPHAHIYANAPTYGHTYLDFGRRLRAITGAFSRMLAV